MSAPDEATGSRGEVEALARVVCPCGGEAHHPREDMGCAWAEALAEGVLASDWLAQHDADQRAEGARAVLDAVEDAFEGRELAAARAAAARFGVTR
jgi:hypothetical protein